MSSALTQIEKLQQQISALKAEGAQQLRSKRQALLQELAKIDAQISELTGASAEGKRAASRKVLTGRSIPLQELKALLAKAPDKTLNLRNEGLQLANIKTLVRVNPHLLALGGKGAWPTVTLLK